MTFHQRLKFSQCVHMLETLRSYKFSVPSFFMVITLDLPISSCVTPMVEGDREFWKGLKSGIGGRGLFQVITT